MSKELVNEQMVGFRETPLEFQDEVEGPTEILTVRKLFLLGCNSYSTENMKDWKIIADVMVRLDEDEKADKPVVSLEDAWYDKVRPHLDTILPKAYKIHSPFMAEQLDRLVAAVDSPSSK